MSMSYSSRSTPRSSASQGRIVTENTALSAILRENSKGNLAPAPRTVSVDSPALDVVSSAVDVVNVSNTSPNIDCQQNVQQVSNSDTSLKNATDVEHLLSPEHKLVSPAENISDTYNHPVVKTPEKVHTPHNSTPSNTYAYRSLKSTYQTDQVSRGPSKSSFAHDIDVSEKLHVNDNQLTNVSNDSVAVIGSGNTNDNSHVHSSENKETLGDKPEHLAQENSSRQNTRHTIQHSRGHGIVSQQNTRLSLYSQHERVDRGRTPLRVNTQDQIVPPLDLSDLHKPVSDNCDNSPNSVDKLEHLTLEDQKLHASDRHTSVSYFSPGVYNPTSRTYEVETPVHDSELPVINSYENFRQDDDQDTFRDRQRGPDALEEHRSDLADELRVPYPFDTQAGNGSLNAQEPKPPSPPVQTTPPPSKEPATSLHSGNNVYAVANPDILRAQGIEPSADNHWTPRQHSNTPRRPSQSEVRFDQSSVNNKGGEVYGGSPVKDRAPTPYAKSPVREELPRSPADWDVPIENSREQSNTSKQGLPPQHPPLDFQHSSKPGSRSSKKVDDNQSVKRVYVESPSFTKEEEEEYRFVSSRLEDIDDKNQATFRAMDNRGYGGDDRPGNDYSLRDNRSRKNDSEYDRRSNEKDRYSRDRYNERNDKYDDRNRERNDDRETDMNRYEDRTREMNGYQNDYNRDRDRNRDTRHDDDYGDRYGGNDRYAAGGSEKYSNSMQDRGRDSYGRQDRYDNLRNERDDYEREPRREDEPNFRQGYGKQYTELDEVDLRKEAEYQKDLKMRIDKQGRKIKDSEKYESKYSRDNYNKENEFARDSLEYPDERDVGQERNSYHHDPHGPQVREWDNPVQSRDWDNPPQNPYQDNGGYYGNQGFAKQDSRPDFYDPDDVEKMELVNPKAPRYDYVEKNKQDYGKNAKKSYREIVHKKKEEEEKLDHIFITPKVPSKKKPKKAQSAQPEHMGHQPPPQYPVGFKPSSAEELWAQKARVLQHKKGSASSGKQAKASASKSMPRWNINNSVKPSMRYENPVPMPNQGQLYKPGNAYQPKEQGGYGQQQGGYSQNQQERYSPYSQSQGGYGTPTRQLQPLENRPAPPVSTEMVPTAVQPSSPYRRHMELKPISQEITTEDGQRISVDINLRLISPPPGQSGPGSPTQTQQLALLPVQETQGPTDQRPLGVPYQMQDNQAGNYDGYNTGYEGHVIPYNDGYTDTMQMDTKYDNGPLTAEEVALADPSGYSKRYQTGSVNYKDDQASNPDTKTLEEGYASIYHKMKNKDPSQHPWYKVYDITDYKKMQREVRLNQGTLGPDLDTETYKEKLEKRHKQFEYARMVMEKNKEELGSKKPPKFPRGPVRSGEEGVKRKTALQYAKNVPKPHVKARPNQYNSYEVASQLSPGAPKSRSPPAPKSTPHSAQTLDMIDIRTLERRHLQERQKADKIRQNMDSVLSPKAQKAH